MRDGVGLAHAQRSCATAGGAVSAEEFADFVKRCDEALETDKAVEGTRLGRNTNKLPADPYAAGAHSTFKRGEDGNISSTATYEPNSNNPSGFQEVKRVDVAGKAHANPDGSIVPTPHVKDAGQKGVRPALPEDLPRTR